MLISPIRVVKRFVELSPEEVADLWSLAQLVGSKLEPHFKAASLTLAIQVCLWDLVLDPPCKCSFGVCVCVGGGGRRRRCMLVNSAFSTDGAVVKRFVELSQDYVADLWPLAQLVGSKLSLTFRQHPLH